ncbi:hypothetical protein IQ260_11085 [Leptolyngbya cf. ectocarpi LEGE 11479]|uniref:Response regulator n=1 Tax=Leptolyngbya cf. ectocarpi LEGE 11479 TaxID=1828722 RepID=A0A928X166_LEPEC|nr:hypothetical protein [Leptolyngbya ectocarpi]MBE9067200.1 hypothetical protein [Leptolyngbya cf. ectocarpi LEGE 11479]
MKDIAIVGSPSQPETLLADLLHWHGLSVFQVGDGDALLPLLSFISPELIIIEAAPGTDALCDRIKRSSVIGHIPVLVCAEIGASCCCSNADAYLCAPYTAEEVFAHIQALRPLKKPLSNTIATSAWIDS